MKLFNFLKKRKKEKSLEILDKVEIENEVKSLSKKIDDDDEPSWYHYVIVFLVLFGTIGLLIGGFEFYDNYYGDNNNFNNQKFKTSTKTFNYPYVVGNVTYNIAMHYPINEIKNSNYPIEVSKLDVLNTIELIMSFKNYNGTDNGKVTIASSVLTAFFKRVFHFSFESDVNFKNFNQSNCSTSNKNNKVIIYDIYSNRSGIFYDKSTSCIKIESKSANEIIKVTDYFMYSLMNEK